MSQLNDIAIFSALQQAGIPEQDRPAFYALAMAEASGDPTITGPVIASGHGCASGQRAVGLFQIVLSCHPEVSQACATDPVCSAKAAYSISNKGKDYSAWSSFGNQAYKDAYNKGKDILARMGGTAPKGDPWDVTGIPGKVASAVVGPIVDKVKAVFPLLILAVAFIVVLVILLGNLKSKAIEEISPIPKES